jgi:hypothetical protein
MLFEIARRRAELKRQQEIVKKYQQELDALYQSISLHLSCYHSFEFFGSSP